jgi:hypothetical protein
MSAAPMSIAGTIGHSKFDLSVFVCSVTNLVVDDLNKTFTPVNILLSDDLMSTVTLPYELNKLGTMLVKETGDGCRL